VSALLAAKGAVVVDADEVVRDQQRPGTTVFDAMVERFGSGIVAADGTLDRAAVADIVFADPAALADLNTIVHPAVGAEIARRMEELSGTDAVVVLDVQMPGMDGPSFARELRMTLRRVPLVILTGVADPRREADRCNAEAYLAKPFDAQELVDVVRRFSA